MWLDLQSKKAHSVPLFNPSLMGKNRPIYTFAEAIYASMSGGNLVWIQTQIDGFAFRFANSYNPHKAMFIVQPRNISLRHRKWFHIFGGKFMMVDVILDHLKNLYTILCGNQSRRI